MALKIIRPPALSEDKREQLTRYLMDQWERAVSSRTEQVDSKLSDWEKIYRGIPAEEVRSVPWYKSSNFVVKIVRLFIDTFQARTLNIVFATRPLYQVGSFDRDMKEAVQYYLHEKACGDWKHYALFKQLLMRGTKQGTVVVKQVYQEDTTIDVSSAAGRDFVEKEVVTFSGPKALCVPFEDIFVYPITANDCEQVQIWFHRVRFTLEAAKVKIAKKLWDVDEDEVDRIAKRPNDVKRQDDQQEAGVYDQHLREVHLVECWLDYEIANTGKQYSIVVTLCPDLNRYVDLYFNPNPSNYPSFFRYSPSDREDLFYGESWSELLAQAQEECSTIHNDRRNAAFLGSAPIFKRRQGANVPNPSTTWYPGKVWDVEEMDDFEVVNIGRNIGDLLSEEMQVLSLAERLMGIGPIMQGMGAGQLDKHGVYNTGGTLAAMSEGNQRQDTNIRDAREVLGEIGKGAWYLQSYFGASDPFLDACPPKVAEQVKAAFAQTSLQRLRAMKFEIRASSAGANREIEKASLLQMANVLGQYSTTLQGLAPQIIQVKEPHLQAMILSIMEMAEWMVKRLLRAFEEYDAEGVIPDVRQLFAPSPTAAGPNNPGVGPGGGIPQATNSGVQGFAPEDMAAPGAGGTGNTLTRQTLGDLLQVVGGARANAGGGGMAM